MWRAASLSVETDCLGLRPLFLEAATSSATGVAAGAAAAAVAAVTSAAIAACLLSLTFFGGTLNTLVRLVLRTLFLRIYHNTMNFCGN